MGEKTQNCRLCILVFSISLIYVSFTSYGGKTAEKYDNLKEKSIAKPIYKEHNAEYMIECIENLREKGIELEV